jgi:hypothetical protein
MKYPGFSNSDRGCLPAIALAQARRAGKPLPQENLWLNEKRTTVVYKGIN